MTTHMQAHAVGKAPASAARGISAPVCTKDRCRVCGGGSVARRAILGGNAHIRDPAFGSWSMRRPIRERQHTLGSK